MKSRDLHFVPDALRLLFDVFAQAMFHFVLFHLLTSVVILNNTSEQKLSTSEFELSTATDHRAQLAGLGLHSLCYRFIKVL